MALDSNARATAIYNAVAATPNFSKLSPAEQASFLQSLKTLYGADTTYLTTNAAITPGTLQVNSGIAVSTTGTAAAQTGSTTATGTLAGSGKLT